MTFQVTDRIKEVATTTGTGTFTLANAVQAGFLRFSDIPGVANGDLVPYCAVDLVPSPAVWEVGMGTYNLTAKTLARTAVTSNSLGTTAAVNFANVPTVFLTETRGMLASACVPQLQTGKYYVQPGASTGSAGATPSKVMMTPFYVPNPMQLQSLSIKTGTNVNSGTVYLGIASDAGGKPGTLLAQNNQALTSANANSSVSLAVSAFLTPGLYWVVQSWNSGVNVYGYQVVSGGGNYGFNPLQQYGASSSVANAMNMNCLGYYSTDSVGTTLPTNFSGLTPNESNYMPAIVALGF